MKMFENRNAISLEDLAHCLEMAFTPFVKLMSYEVFRVATLGVQFPAGARSSARVSPLVNQRNGARLVRGGQGIVHFVLLSFLRAEAEPEKG